MLIGISGYIGSGKDTVAKIIQLIMAYEKPHTKFIRTINSWKDQNTLSEFVIQLLRPQYEGKDFFKMGYANWEVKKFAGKLKEICSLLTGIPVADFELQSVKDSVLSKEWDIWSVQCSVNGKLIGEPMGIFSTPEEAVEAEKMWTIAHQWQPELKREIVARPMKVRTLLQLMGTDAMRNQVHPNIHINALFADYKPTQDKYFTEVEDSGVKEIAFEEPIYPNWIISDLRFGNEFDAIKQRGGITVRVERPQPGPKKHDSDGFVYPVRHESETALDGHKFDYTIYNSGTIEELLVKVEQMLKENKLL